MICDSDNVPKLTNILEEPSPNVTQNPSTFLQSTFATKSLYIVVFGSVGLGEPGVPVPVSHVVIVSPPLGVLGPFYELQVPFYRYTYAQIK